METQIKYIVQSWSSGLERWFYVHLADDYEIAKKDVAFRKKMDGHDKQEYRIVRATTTYEVMEETK